MVKSKHSPPLTTMTKDNLVCHCCTHFDIGFPIFLLSDNFPYQHISSFKLFASVTLLTRFGANHCLSNDSLSYHPHIPSCGKSLNNNLSDKFIQSPYNYASFCSNIGSLSVYFKLILCTFSLFQPCTSLIN